MRMDNSENDVTSNIIIGNKEQKIISKNSWLGAQPTVYRKQYKLYEKKNLTKPADILSKI